MHVPRDRVAADRIDRGRAEDDVVVTRQGIHIQVHREIQRVVIDPQDLDPVVDGGRKVLVTIRRGVPQRIGQFGPGDDRDIVVAVGPHDDRTIESGHLSGFDMVKADPGVAADQNPSLVRFWSGFEDHRTAAAQNIEAVAGGLADRIAAVDEHRDRTRHHVERVVAFQAEHRQRFVVLPRHRSVHHSIVAVVYHDTARRDVDVERL